MADVPPVQTTINVSDLQNIEVKGTFTEAGPVILIGHRLLPGSGVAVFLHEALDVGAQINRVAYQMLLQMQADARKMQQDEMARQAGLLQTGHKKTS